MWIGSNKDLMSLAHQQFENHKATFCGMCLVFIIVCYRQTGCTTVHLWNSPCSWFMITWYNTDGWYLQTTWSLHLSHSFPSAQIHSILVHISIKMFHISKISSHKSVFRCNIKILWHLNVCLCVYTCACC